MPKPKQHDPTRESKKIHDAFIYYWELGDNRTHQEVADKFGVSVQTVKKWSMKFLWKQRVIDFEREIAKELEKEAINKALNARKEDLEILLKVKKRFKDKLEEEDKNPMQMVANMADLERLIKLELLLHEVPTDITQQDIKIISSTPQPGDKVDKADYDVD